MAKTGADKWKQWVRHTGKVMSMEMGVDKKRPLPESAKRHMQHVPYGGKDIELTEVEDEDDRTFDRYRAKRQHTD